MIDNKVWEADDPWFDGKYDPFGNKLYKMKFPLFEISTNPYIPLVEIKERRFDLIERAQNLCRDELQNSILFEEVWKADDPFVWELLPLYTMEFGACIDQEAVSMKQEENMSLAE